MSFSWRRYRISGFTELSFFGNSQDMPKSASPDSCAGKIEVSRVHAPNTKYRLAPSRKNKSSFEFPYLMALAAGPRFSSCFLHEDSAQARGVPDPFWL